MRASGRRAGRAGAADAPPAPAPPARAPPLQRRLRLVGALVAPLAMLALFLYAFAPQLELGAQAFREPPIARPRHAVIMVTPGLGLGDLAIMLASVAEAAPSVALHVVATRAQADFFIAAANAPATKLWLRLYDWEKMSARLDNATAALAPAIRRYFLYAAVLDDIAPEGAGAGDVVIGGIGQASRDLLYCNFDAERFLPPHAVLLTDARDLVLQRDPFPTFWGFAALSGGRGPGSGVLGGLAALVAWAREGGGATPAAPAAVEAAWAAERVIVVAGEARVQTVGGDDINRAWVSHCFLDLGEAMVAAEQIYCSGTTLGTVPGLRAYLREGFLPAVAHCQNIGHHHGMDQGIHNVLTHRYSPAQLDGWRASARAGGPFRPGGAAEPRLAAPLDFLDLVQRFQGRVAIHVAHAESGYICTMALLMMFADLQGGEVVPAAGKDPCAIVHQYDRSDLLLAHFRKKYGGRVKTGEAPAGE